MRTFVLLLAFSLCIIDMSLGQDSKPATASPEVQPESFESYMIQLTEYRIEGAGDPSQTTDQIVKRLTARSGQANSDLVETVRLSVLSGGKSMVQFGKRVTLTVGTVSSRGSTSRQTQQMEIGTLLRVTATPQSGQVLLDLSYESSRLDDNETEDSAPNILTTQIETRQLVELGEPTLISGTHADNSTYTILTVTH